MAGNVWEWVRDFFDRTFYENSRKKNPYNNVRGAGYRVIRGGSWASQIDTLHVTRRGDYWPFNGSKSIGFRCAR